MYPHLHRRWRRACRGISLLVPLFRTRARRTEGSGIRGRPRAELRIYGHFLAPVRRFQRHRRPGQTLVRSFPARGARNSSQTAAFRLHTLMLAKGILGDHRDVSRWGDSVANVWPAPGLQACSLSDELWRSASNVFGLFAEPAAAGHDGYARTLVLITIPAYDGRFATQVSRMPVRPLVHRYDHARRHGGVLKRFVDLPPGYGFVRAP